jgi:hypothetical protein
LKDSVNVQEVITSVNHKRNGEAKAALNILTSSVSGKNIFERKGAVNSLAKKLGVNCRILELVFLFFLLGHHIWFSGWCKETTSVWSARLWFLFSSLSVKFYNLRLVFLLSYLLLPFFNV